MHYTVKPANPGDENQTKATSALFKIKIKNNKVAVNDLNTLCTNHVAAWGSLQFTREAKATVVLHESITNPLREDVEGGHDSVVKVL
jgi:hypothetical protein